MDLEWILKALVPLSFLAIWALTWLFNREGNSLPARTSSPPNPYGPRPGMAPRPGGLGPPERPPTLRWGPQNVSPMTPRAGGDDDIVILDSSRPLRVAAAPRVPRRVRPRPAPPVAPKPNPIVSTRIGMGNVTQNVNQSLVVPMTVEPLTTTLASSTARPAAAVATRPVDLAAKVSAQALVRSATDPQRLREAILLNEILQPPLALRGRRG